MEKQICISCEKNKTDLMCGACDAITCKHCATFVDEDTFEFFNLLPESLQNKAFCHSCFTSKISGEIDSLKELLRKAKQV